MYEKFLYVLLCLDLFHLVLIFSGLFNPEAFITATRQCVDQANSWSLEELHLDVCEADESDKPSFDDCSFAVEGLKLSELHAETISCSFPVNYQQIYI